MLRKVRLWLALTRACRDVSKRSTGYMWGAGHGANLDDVSPGSLFDCSSSVSYVLRRSGMFPWPRAIVSGDFVHWGRPGRGKWFTVYYSTEHVWIRFHRSPRYWRFDTSPWGYGRNGPRMRVLPRLTTGFHARHWPGM